MLFTENQKARSLNILINPMYILLPRNYHFHQIFKQTSLYCKIIGFAKSGCLILDDAKIYNSNILKTNGLNKGKKKRNYFSQPTIHCSTHVLWLTMILLPCIGGNTNIMLVQVVCWEEIHCIPSHVNAIMQPALLSTSFP